MTTVTDIIDVDALKASAQQLVATLAACVTQGQVASTLAEAPLPDVKAIAKELGLSFKQNVKGADLAPAVADEWNAQMAVAEAPKALTAEEILAEEMAKLAAKRTEAKAPKPVDPQAEARKARYAAADAERERQMALAKVEDMDVVAWIVTQLRMDPGAVCAREMDVYRWLEGRKVGHQRWNGLWATAQRLVDQDDDDADIDPPTGGEGDIPEDEGGELVVGVAFGGEVTEDETPGIDIEAGDDDTEDADA